MSIPDRTQGPRPIRPTPARPNVEAPKADPRPTPVRESLEGATSAAEPSGELEPEHVEMQIDGDSWTVRVSGRGRTVGAPAAAALVLLAFHRDGAAEPERESLVVGRGLGYLSELQLREAFRASRVPRDDSVPPGLFEGASGKKGRRRS